MHCATCIDKPDPHASESVFLQKAFERLLQAKSSILSEARMCKSSLSGYPRPQNNS